MAGDRGLAFVVIGLIAVALSWFSSAQRAAAHPDLALAQQSTLGSLTRANSIPAGVAERMSADYKSFSEQMKVLSAAKVNASEYVPWSSEELLVADPAPESGFVERTSGDQLIASSVP